MTAEGDGGWLGFHCDRHRHLCSRTPHTLHRDKQQNPACFCVVDSHLVSFKHGCDRLELYTLKRLRSGAVISVAAGKEKV